MTPEGKVKKRATDVLKRYVTAWWFAPMTHGYGASGAPDIIGCYRGRMFWIECKARSGRVTALQDAQHARIREAGGKGWVVYEGDDFATWFAAWVCEVEDELRKEAT